MGNPNEQVKQMARHRHGRRGEFVLASLTWLYLAVVLSAWMILRSLGDSWWIATVMLFGPRWVIALPLVVLAPAALVSHRKLLWPMAAIALIITILVIGFSLPIRRLLGNGSVPYDLRVLSYNIGGGHVDPTELKILLDEIQPDIAALQECRLTEKNTALFSGWHIHLERGLCLASKFPILKVESRDRSDIYHLGGSGAMVRYQIEWPHQTLYVVNLHLETPREGIQTMIHQLRRYAHLLRRRPFEGIKAMMNDGFQESSRIIDAENFLRAFESKKAREWVDQTPNPILIMGDFNTPVDSVIYNTYWSDFANAFSEAGLGFGRTKRTGWFGIRIDHVLAGSEWEYQRAWIGPHLDTDHRPMIADMRWVGGSSKPRK